MSNQRTCRRLLAIFTSLSAATIVSAQDQPGEIVWTFDMANVTGAFVTVAPDGSVYAIDQERLWALNPSGTIRWTFEGAAGLGSLSSAGGGNAIEFLPDGRLVVAAGHTIWALETDGTVSWSFSWTGGYNNQIDNGPSVGPDGNIYATTAINDGQGMGVFSLTPDGQLRWQDDANNSLYIINASHGQRFQFTDTRAVFGFIATTGAPTIYAYDFDGNQTNLVNYTCTSSPKTNGIDRLLLAGVCGLKSIDLSSDTIEWSVSLGPVNMLPITGADGVVYSGSWHGPVTAISPQGQVLWTSSNVGLQRTLAVSDKHDLVLYAGETFGQPNWFGAIDATTGSSLWQVPFESINGHNELSWSNEAAFSPDGTIAYFITRFTSNAAPGQIWAVRIADATDSGCSAADLALPFGVLDFSDVVSFLGAFGSTAPEADLAEPIGVFDFSDVVAFLAAFGAGCP